MPKTKSTPIKASTDEPKKHSYQSLTLVIATLALICSALSLAGNVGSGVVTLTDFINSTSDGNSANFTDGSIADVAAKVSPAVVSIVTETRGESFFGQSSTSSAAGTGIIVTKDGYVLTNKHVVEDANSISIVLDNGTTYESNEVTLIGTDPSNDIAFLKIKGATDLPFAELGDSKTVNVGQQVIAIGNALGQFQNTVTEGIISGTGRSITASDSAGLSAESLVDMLQTDASINAGNSGGPLVNAAGQVIGINTAVTSGANGIGFAIPISSVKGILKTLVETGTLKRAYLGVYYTNITPSFAKSNNLSVTSGAYVSNTSGSAVIKNSPAAKAGLKDSDIITKVNGIAVGAKGSLSTLIGEYAPGETVTLTINRDGEELTLNVTLEEYPDHL